MAHGEQNTNLIRSVYDSEVVGHGNSETITPEEDLALAIVENAIYDYKLGYQYLIELVGRRKAKMIAKQFSSLCNSEYIKRYYRRMASNDQYTCAGAKTVILYAMFHEIKIWTEKKLRGNRHLNSVLLNMFDSEMFFRQDHWCSDLCGMSGLDILEMIQESEGINSQKKQVA
jgi:hypothetical protein